VEDPAVNDWLALMSSSTKVNVASLPADTRQKVCQSVWHRTQTRSVAQPEAYLNGAINCERAGFGIWSGAVGVQSANKS
jgi:hypothetical protein